MRLPPELYDHIIDQFCVDANKREVLNLRNACRGWISRVNCHAFRRLELHLDQTTLAFVREHRIGYYAKELSIPPDPCDYSRASTTLGLASRKDLEEFYATLANVDTLSIAIGDIGSDKRIPWMRTVKNLKVKMATFRITRVFDLLCEAPCVTSVICAHYGVGSRSDRSYDIQYFASNRVGLYSFHFDRQKARYVLSTSTSTNKNTTGKGTGTSMSMSISPEETSSLSQRGPAHIPLIRHTSDDSWRQLTHCSIQFEVGKPSFDAGPDLPDNVSTPSLRSLRFLNVLPQNVQLIGSWIRAGSKSLRYLEFGFYRALRREDPFGLLSVSEFTTLEHICILMRRPNHLQQNVIRFLASLTTIGSIKVSLQGFHYTPDLEIIDQLDQVLSANPAIQNVEIISNDSVQSFLSKLRTLQSKGLLQSSHDYIDSDYYRTV